MSDIWQMTRSANVLLADLATRNINVFYELGLAHAIGKPVVLVSDSIDDIPFDLRGLRVLLYDRNNPEWGAGLRRDLTTALLDTIREPLAAIPSAFASHPTTVNGGNLPREGRSSAQMKRDVEFLKREVAAIQLATDPLKQLSYAFPRSHSRFPLGQPAGSAPDVPDDSNQNES